jgi:DNA-binding transcriptional regulator PaaX
MVNKKLDIIKDILYVLGILGCVTCALIAPGLSIALKDFFPNKSYSNPQIKRSFSRLKSKGYLKYAHNKHLGKWQLSLTEKGLKQRDYLMLHDLKIAPQKKWDKKYRLVLFDIPERNKYARDFFVYELKRMEFSKLQKSVWMHKFPCASEIDQITMHLRIRRFVKICTVDQLC